MKIQVKKFEWEEKHSEIFESIKAAVANITKVHYYDPKLATRVKCDTSRSGLGATLEQQKEEGEWIPIAFASRYLNTKEKKYSTNELELLAVVWSVDRFKHYLLGKEFVIATDHKALVSALDENKSNKTYQSRLTRWVDRLLPYQFKFIHIPGKDMGIVDYLSRNPKGEPWPESVLDEKFVVPSIESFHKALDCLHSRLSDHDRLDRNENFLEYSRIDQNVSNQNMSSNSCYGNQNGLKWTRHDRSERKTILRSLQQEMCEKSKFNSKISLSQNCRRIQSVESLKLDQNLANCEYTEMNPRETSKTGKGKKMIRIQDRNDTLREEVTETTFQRRTRTIQRTPNRSDSENADAEEIPQVEWYLKNRQIWTNTANNGQSTSTAETAHPSIVSFWELMGSEKNEDRRSVIELEADSFMQSPKSPRQNTSGDETKTGQIIEVDLIVDSIDDREYGSEVSVVTPQQTIRVGHRSRKHEHQLAEQANGENGPL